MSPIKIICIGGPTASGKTEASLDLAKKFNGAIISCDSRQIYEDLDVATDKAISSDEIRLQRAKDIFKPVMVEGIEHYGLNIANVEKPFTLYDWQKYAEKVIKKIDKEGKVPFLVGGTGLYIQTLINRYELSEDYDEKLRRKLNELTLEQLQIELNELDPETFKKIDTKNPRRLIRAIEKAISSQKEKGKSKKLKGKRKKSAAIDFQSLVLSFKPDREIIRRKIENRVGRHQELGVIGEVYKLVEKYGANNEILNSTISIQEYIPFVLGEITLEEAQQQVITNNYRYAKRQMTWFKKYGETKFCGSIKEMANSIKKFLAN